MTSLAPALGLITFGVWEALFVFAIVVLLFGARRIPELAKGLGEGIRNFRSSMKEGESEGDKDEERGRSSDSKR